MLATSCFLRRAVVTPSLVVTGLVAGLVSGCGSSGGDSRGTALNRMSAAGGDLTFRFLDESRQARDGVDDAIAQGVVGLVINAEGFIESAVPGCFPGTKYTFRANRPVREQHGASHDSSDDISSVFSGGLVGANESASENTRIELITVGRYSTETPPATIAERPDCARVNGVLRAVEVGAFEIHEDSGQSEGGSLGAGMGIGLESSTKRAGRTVRGEGDLAVCAQASRRATEPPEACSVPIRGKVEPFRSPREIARAETAPNAHTRSREDDEIEREAPESSPDESRQAGTGTLAYMVGRYSCGTSEWISEIRLKASASGDQIYGSLSTASVDDPELQGHWGILVEEQSSGMMLLNPTEPFDLPSGYLPVVLVGRMLDGEFVGQVAAPGCSAFRFRVE